MADDKGKSDLKMSASSYIVNFHNIVEGLSHNYSIYFNLLLEIGHKYKSSESGELLQSLTAEENKKLFETVQSLRYTIERSYIGFHSLKGQLHVEKDNVTPVYDELGKTFFPERNLIRNYVIALNQLLVNNVLQELLSSSQQFLGSVMGEAQRQTS